MPKPKRVTAYKTSKKRSRIMAAIRSSNTQPEIIVRKLLYRNGYRYRLHYKALPGSPDVAMTKQKIAVFIQGCFWHYHDCHIAHIPKNNTAFWYKKMKRNLIRDKKNLDALQVLGWRVLFIWECAVMTRSRLSQDALLEKIHYFIRSNSKAGSITGTF